MTIEYEGFLQQTEEGEWLLCDTPNLKSCCLHKHTLITLEGDFSRYSNHAAVTVQGILSDGVLKEVRVQEKNGSIPYGFIGAVLVVIVAICLIIRRRGRPLPP